MNTTTIKSSFVLAVAFAVTLLMQLALITPVHAAGDDSRAWVSGAVWDGGGDGTTFNDAANWENDTLPVSGEAISLNTNGMTGGTFTVDLNTEGGNVSAFDYIRLGGDGSGEYILTGDALVLDSGIDNDGDLYNYQTFKVEADITLAGNSDFRAGSTLVIGASDGSNTLDVATFTMTKKGQYPLTINSVLSGSGGVTVSGGEYVASEDSTLALTIGNGGTLKGADGVSVGDVTIQSGGTVAPGLSPGCLLTGNIAYTSGSTYQVEIDSATVCSGYDQTQVTGTVDLGDATLSIVKLASYTPADASTFIIIDNDGTADPVTGTFNGLAEGATTTVDDVEYTVSYVGGDGNDVVLSATAVAAPATGFGSTATNYALIALFTAAAAATLAVTGRKLDRIKN